MSYKRYIMNIVNFLLHLFLHCWYVLLICTYALLIHLTWILFCNANETGIISTWNSFALANEEPLDHLRVYRKSAVSAQTDGRIGRTVTRKYHRAEESLILTSKIVILAYNPFFQESLWTPLRCLVIIFSLKVQFLNLQRFGKV